MKAIVYEKYGPPDVLQLEEVEKPTNLRDGTPAYETIFEYKLVGVFKTKSKHLSVIKDEKWIRVSISAAANNLNENLKEILDSLEFQ